MLQDLTAYKLDTGVLEKIAKKAIFAYNKYNDELKTDTSTFFSKAENVFKFIF